MESGVMAVRKNNIITIQIAILCCMVALAYNSMCMHRLRISIYDAESAMRAAQETMATTTELVQKIINLGGLAQE